MVTAFEVCVPQQSVGLVPTEASTPLDLLALALRNNAAIDVIERLAALQREQRDYLAKVAFDEALNRCQEKLRQVSADASNPQTNSRYASYAALDRAVRPIYTAELFSVSFGEQDCPTPGKTRFIAYLSRCGVTREYIKDVSPSTKGPKGNDVMTPIHADAAADSYAKRYHLKNIFNIAIGEGDTDGNASSSARTGAPDRVNMDRVSKNIESLQKASTMQELFEAFKIVYREALDQKDNRAMDIYVRAKETRKRELSRGVK